MRIVKKLLMKYKASIINLFMEGGYDAIPQGGTRTKRKECLELLLTLNPEILANYTPAIAAGLYIRSQQLSIVQMTQWLESMAIKVERNEAILTAIINAYSFTTSSLDSFISIDKGVYKNPRDSLIAFKEGALRLCTALEPSDDVDAEASVYHYNARILAATLDSIQDVIVQLRAVEVRL